MPRSPIVTTPVVIGSLAVITTVLGATSILVEPGPVAPSAVPLIVVGLVIAVLTGLSGLLLARAPWGRWVLAACTIGSMFVASIEVTPWTWITLVVGAVALVGCFGPWLRLWIRHARLVGAPGPVVVFLLAVGPAAPLTVGLASGWAGASVWSWALALALLACSVLYGRGVRLALWGMRIAIPILGAAAATTTGLPGASIIVAGSAAVTVAAWLPAARRTTTVIAPVLPEPVHRTTRREVS